MVQKVLVIGTNGLQAEIAPNTASAGAADAGKLLALNAAGAIDATALPAGIGADAQSMVFSEAVAAGAPVNLWLNGGVVNARNADGSAGKEAQGFTLAAVASGAAGTVTYSGTITGMTGLTIGAPIFLGITAGTFTQTPPSTTGQTLQRVGTATGATQMHFLAGQPIVRAWSVAARTPLVVGAAGLVVELPAGDTFNLVDAQITTLMSGWFSRLPTSLPGTAGQPWNNAGTLAWS